MKKLLLATCLLTIAQSTLCLDENKAPFNTNNPKDLVEKFAAKALRRFFKYKRIESTLEDLKQYGENSNHQLSEKNKELLKKNGFLNDDGTIKEGIAEHCCKLSMLNREERQEFMERHNIK